MVISASALGKYKTVFEVASIFFLILDGSYFFIHSRPVGIVFLWAAAGIAVVSGADYFRKYLKAIIV
jgi:CDP-diacylglycerol--glycerol-3-phosphate 3-phosphatidyltransferase